MKITKNLSIYQHKKLIIIKLYFYHNLIKMILIVNKKIFKFLKIIITKNLNYYLANNLILKIELFYINKFIKKKILKILKLKNKILEIKK